MRFGFVKGHTSTVGTHRGAVALSN